LAFFAFITASVSVNAQEISNEQWTMVSKKTATWCPFCGQWGWTFKDFLLEDYRDDNVVVWMLHHSGELETPTSSALADNFGGAGQPVFFINTDNMFVSSSNLNAKRGEFQTIIETLNGLEPFAGVGSTASFDGEKITSTSRVQFTFDLEGGDYWLAAYLVADEIIEEQASIGDEAVHENVLLHSFSGDAYFGENIISNQAISSGQEFFVEGELDFSGQMNIPDYADGYSIVTVLWSRLNGNYIPFNLNKQPISRSTSTQEILNSIDVFAYHMGDGQINLNIKSNQQINDAHLTLLDINGRTIATQNEIQINDGNNEIVLDAAQNLQLGTYIVLLESPMGSRSIKVSVR